MAGCMLYWAEGSKARSKVIFTNSDADMVRFSLRFLASATASATPRCASASTATSGTGAERPEWLDLEMEFGGH